MAKKKSSPPPRRAVALWQHQLRFDHAALDPAGLLWLADFDGDLHVVSTADGSLVRAVRISEGPDREVKCVMIDGATTYALYKEPRAGTDESVCSVYEVGGAPRLLFSTEKSICTGAAFGSRFLLADDDEDLALFDQHGAELWRIRSHNTLPDSPDPPGNYGSYPILADTAGFYCAYATYDRPPKGCVVAYDWSGHVRWRADYEHAIAKGCFAQSADALLLYTWEGQLVVVGKDGRHRLTTAVCESTASDFDGSGSNACAISEDGTRCYGAAGAYLFSFDETGQLLWDAKMPMPIPDWGRRGAQRLLLAGDSLFVHASVVEPEDDGDPEPNGIQRIDLGATPCGARVKGEPPSAARISEPAPPEPAVEVLEAFVARLKARPDVTIDELVIGKPKSTKALAKMAGALPDDLLAFYARHDGYRLRWSFKDTGQGGKLDIVPFPKEAFDDTYLDEDAFDDNQGAVYSLPFDFHEPEAVGVLVHRKGEGPKVARAVCSVTNQSKPKPVASSFDLYVKRGAELGFGPYWAAGHAASLEVAKRLAEE